MLDERDLKDPILPIGRPKKGSAGETGFWRSGKHPKINLESCTKCYICWQVCPEACIEINEEGWPEVDLTYCKYCAICLEECPKDCITEEKE